MKTLLKHYFEALAGVARQGDGREEIFYPCLQAFLQQVAASAGKRDI